MIVVDSGVLIAAADVDDDHYESCARLIAERGSEFLVPSAVVVEVCWMLSRHVSVPLEADFLDAIAEGELQLAVLEQIDYARMSELVTTYADLPLGMVDASVVAIAESLDVREIATIDRRHFSVVRRGMSMLSRFCPESDNDIPGMTLAPVGGNYDPATGPFL